MSDTRLTLIRSKKLLGLEDRNNPSEEEVRKAYHQRVKLLHPDSPESKNLPAYMKDVDFDTMKRAKDMLMKAKETIFLLPVSIGSLMAGELLSGFRGICGACDGHGHNGRSECPKCHGEGGIRNETDGIITQDVCSRCGGSGEISDECVICDGRGYKLFDSTISIPAGTTPGTIIPIDTGENIQIILGKKQRGFSLNGSDIHCNIQAPWTKMIKGGPHIAKDPNGTPLEIELKPGSYSGSQYVVYGKGLKKSSGERGDIIFHVSPKVPKPEKVSSITLKGAIKLLERAGY